MKDKKEDYASFFREMTELAEVLDEFFELRKINAELLDALKEIAEGKGRYSMDRLEHATNTVEDMKQLAKAAIAKAGGEK